MRISGGKSVDRNGAATKEDHIHIQPIEMFKPQALELMKKQRANFDQIAEFCRSPQAFLKYLDAAGVDRAVLINYVAPEVIGITDAVNPWIARYVEGHRDRLVPVGGIHPRHSRDVAGDMKKLLDVHRLGAIKLHPPHMELAANAYRTDCPSLADVYRLAGEAKRPVFIHTGTSVFPGARNVYASIQDRSRALGMSHFVATGDTGAFTCGLDQNPAGSFPSTLPTVTAVGGTTVFESREGVYFKEYAWGSPLDESVGADQLHALVHAEDADDGGFESTNLEGVAHGLRQVPDVSGDGDPLTGYHILFNGREGQAGGTSASTPLWAATVALINQDLNKKGLREVGFANPALYWMGENSAKLNPKPFHDVVGGNNLGYDAVAGWDFATGWGSMDAVALDAAWIRYIKSGGG